MRLYFKYFGIHLRSQMQYKSSFFLLMFGQALASFTVFLGVRFMFYKFNSVKGFSYTEVMLCFAIMLMAYSLAEFFFRGFDGFAAIMSQGMFDRIMVRPRNEVFQVVCARIDFSRVGRMLHAIFLFCYALPSCGVHWNLAKVLTLLFMIIGGVFMISALFIAYAGICFFTIEGLEFMNILTDGSREFGTYPFSIYGDGVLKIFTYIIPLACFQYYPFLYLTGTSNNPVYAFLPIISILFMIPCFLLWRAGVKRFASTGS